MPQFDDIDRTTEVITGVDGNQIMLFLPPKQVGDSIHCIVQCMEGNGFDQAADPRRALAEQPRTFAAWSLV